MQLSRKQRAHASFRGFANGWTGRVLAALLLWILISFMCRNIQTTSYMVVTEGLEEAESSNELRSGHRIILSHNPKSDLLGSFIVPTLYLLSIAKHYNFEFEIIDYKQSQARKNLIHLFGLGANIGTEWGSGFQDVSNRENYNPVELNEVVYDVLGFFPGARSSPSAADYIHAKDCPDAETLRKKYCANVTDVCHLQFPSDPMPLTIHMMQHGGIDFFWNETFRIDCRAKFLNVNSHRLSHFAEHEQYHVAIHIRRGDILNKKRWMDQKIYGSVARHICRQHDNAHIHIYSSGKNRDGDWAELEMSLDGSNCQKLSYHLDEHEFNTWAHFVDADALVMSKSTFAYGMALFSKADVYVPSDWWHLMPSRWIKFQSDTGAVMANKSV